MRPPIRPKFWRRTPPAVFPALFGLFGAGLALRRAGDLWPALGPAAGDLVLGVTFLVYLFAAGAYAAKFSARPGVLMEDLRTLPGRAGIASLSLSAMLLAAVLIPFWPAAAHAVLWFALALHTVVAVLVIRTLARLGPEGRQPTPVWHLSFVGFIVAPVAAAPLGYVALSAWIFAATLTAAALIYGASAAQFLRRPPPAPLRPLLAIHLSPLSLFGTVAALIGLDGYALAIAALSTLLAVALLASARWLTEAGFSPLWGAFTFPTAAYGGLLLTLADGRAPLAAAGVAVTAFATVLTVWIAARVLRLWARGTLAGMTNAAVA